MAQLSHQNLGQVDGTGSDWHLGQNPQRDLQAVDRNVRRNSSGTSLVVQWLRLCAPNAGGTGSIPGRETNIPYATWCGQK